MTRRTLFLALSLVALVACIGPRAKGPALFPPAALAWPAVESDYQRGVADGVADGDLAALAAEDLLHKGEALGAALEVRSVEQLRLVPWATTMSPWATRGIADKLEDGEIGPGVADSLREQLVNFTETINRLQGGL